MTWTIATLTAEPGAKTSGTVTVDLGTTTAEVPLILLHGSRPGPTVVITGGVHGGEFAGIAATARIFTAARLAAATAHLAVARLLRAIAAAAVMPSVVLRGRRRRRRE